MKVTIERKLVPFELSKKTHDIYASIDKNSDSLKKFALNEQKITFAREFYAASKIQAIIRGYLDRILCAKKWKIKRATELITRIIRGKLGRIRWRQEYWRSKSVVKSERALKELIDRSTLLRESVLRGTKGYYWIEYFDPLTNSFWYYNKLTKLNTWTCPVVFQKKLICHWNGFPEFGGKPHEKPCRKVFDSYIEYEGHLRTAHKWYCVACNQCNAFLTFPKCFLCGNKYNEEGEDGEKILQESIEKVQKKLAVFLSFDITPENEENYNIKNRLVEIAAKKKLSNLSIDQVSTLPQLVKADMTNKTSGSNSNALALVKDIVNGGLTTDTSSDEKGKKTRKGINSAGTTLAPSITGFYCQDLIPKSVIVAAERNEFLATGGLDGEVKRFEDPVLHGLLNSSEFDDATDMKVLATIHDDDSSDDDDDSVSPIGGSSIDKQKVRKSIKELPKLQVCEPFLNGLCTISTCPLAHPGIRDASVIKWKATGKRNDYGEKIKLPFVSLCPDFDLFKNECTAGSSCSKYHIYIRPSTKELILRMYPIREGKKTKFLSDGIIVRGNVINDKFQGYGTCNWPDGSSYCGDWSNDFKHGVGIYRTKDGSEYVGMFHKGKKQGWGVYSNTNGEEYTGEWRDGKMEGIGQLKCQNGDTYTGEFNNNRYHGIGIFKKKIGDTFMGYSQNGVACGLGVLSLSTGEKYKGYFEYNMRHGKGACAYPNKSRYVGEWYRGCHEGFGIYLSPKNEKYVGYWAGNKKDGKGRYTFANGDFYDGEFCKNKAKGFGVYYHSHGNIYSGEWDNDKRNGKGTYVYVNGSKYTGMWLDNDIHFKGRFDFANGNYYRGQFQHNVKHGKGIFTWQNGNIYKGEFQNDKMCGKGEMIYSRGHSYVGEWSNNMKNGRGSMYYASGAYYEGFWVADVRQEYGKLVFLKDSCLEESYEGEWKEDKYHGKGIYKYRRDEGTSYEGNWIMGVRHGHGLITYSDGSFYRGDFQKNQMWGKGVYVNGPDGTQYDGDWRANMRQGTGTSIEKDGSIYHGQYFGNMKQGNGTLHRPDGSSYTGTWEGNVIVGTGKVCLIVGNKEKRDGLPKQVSVKVFGY